MQGIRRDSQRIGILNVSLKKLKGVIIVIRGPSTKSHFLNLKMQLQKVFYANIVELKRKKEKEKREQMQLHSQ